MKNKIYFLFFILISLPSFSEEKTNSKEIKNLDELLIRVKQDQIDQIPELKKRELKFLKLKNQQKFLFNQAMRELRKEEKIMISLQSIFEEQEKDLSALEKRLLIVTGTLGELFGIVKQNAGEMKSELDNSIISAEYPDREIFFQNLAQRKKLPNTNELKKLWQEIQREIIESGKVSEFKKEVIKKNGKKELQNIIRIGTFNLISKGKYLIYQADTKNIIELPKQVHRKFLSMAKKLEKSKDGLSLFGLDPSRGTLISLLIQNPSLTERIAQGGLIGYLILILFTIGCLLSVKKFREIKIQEFLIQTQLQSSPKILPNNPLGDIMTVFKKYKNIDLENLELKIEEIVVKKISPLQKGVSTIKLLASITPLLGLLGTVTGMIITFQSITLFGTGDPKLMAGGISQALVTTVLGLTAAIPLILIHNFISSKVKNLMQIYEEESLGMLSEREENK